MNRPDDPGRMDGEAPGGIEGRLRAALREAIATRDVVAAFALRSALSAIGNAGAVPAAPGAGASAAGPHVAGAVAGLETAEVPRRYLTQADVGAIVRAEAAERQSTADQYDQHGHQDRAERLRREAAILLATLDGR